MQIVSNRIFLFKKRKIAIVDIGDSIYVAFYQRTGHGGDSDNGPNVGQWAPFFGISLPSRWFVKPKYGWNQAEDESKPYHRYGNEELKQVALWLDSRDIDDIEPQEIETNENLNYLLREIGIVGKPKFIGDSVSFDKISEEEFIETTNLQKTMHDIFGPTNYPIRPNDPSVPRKWKNYDISWCSHCGCYFIVCPDCGNTSCNGGACAGCSDDFDRFHGFIKEWRVENKENIK